MMNYETGVIAEADADADVAAGAHDPAYPPVGEGEPERRRRRWWWALGLLALVLAGGFLYAKTRTDETAAATAAAQADSQLPVISVVRPGRQTVAGTITATGTLAARRAVPVGVVGEGGRVVAVNVDAGAWVRQGQVLAVIDRSVQTEQAQGAAAQISVARADAELAQANLARAQALVGRGFISKAEVDRLTATRDAARARVRVAEATYRELQARNARLNILAPASGLVLERNVEPGQTVGAGGAAVFTLAKGGEMELLARVGEGDLAKLHTGLTAAVTPVGASQSFSGSIWQIAPLIDAQDRQGTVRVALPYSPQLRPGGFASAVIASGTVVAPVLPESAIMSDDKGDYVYVLDAKDRVVRRPVTQGEVTADGIIIAAGLSGDERVILRAGGFVNPGEKVKPVAARN